MTEQDAALTEVQYTRDDYVAAYQLHGTPTRRTWLMFVIVVMAMGALAYIFDSFQAALWTTPFAAVGGLASALLAWAVYVPWAARRSYARYPLTRLQRRIGLLPEGLRSESERGGNTLLWRDFIQWRSNPKMVLLYLSPRLFLLMPARLAAQGFPIDRLRETLMRELGPPKR